MSDVVSELTLINLTVGPSELSPAVFDVIVVLSLELVSVRAHELTHSLSFSSHKLSSIRATILPLVAAFPLELSIDELSLI